MKDSVIEYDDTVIEELNSLLLDFNFNSSNYNDELYTTNYANNIIQELLNNHQLYLEIINEASNYLKKLNEAESVIQPDLDNDVETTKANNSENSNYNYGVVGTSIMNAVALIGKVVSSNFSNNKIKVYEQSNSKLDVISEIKNNTNVTITGVENDMYKIQLTDGEIGYISKNDIEVSNICGLGSIATNDNSVSIYLDSNSTNEAATINNGALINIIGEENSMFKILVDNKVCYVKKSDVVIKSIGESYEV